MACQSVQTGDSEDARSQWLLWAHKAWTDEAHLSASAARPPTLCTRPCSTHPTLDGTSAREPRTQSLPSEQVRPAGGRTSSLKAPPFRIRCLSHGRALPNEWTLLVASLSLLTEESLLGARDRSLSPPLRAGFPRPSLSLAVALSPHLVVPVEDPDPGHQFLPHLGALHRAPPLSSAGIGGRLCHEEPFSLQPSIGILLFPKTPAGPHLRQELAPFCPAL